MSFEARIYIQGAAFYVPHTDGTKLLALFAAHEPGSIRDREGRTLDRHSALIQCHGGLLGLPDHWTSLDVSGHWIGIHSTAPQLELPQDGRVPLLPTIDEIFRPDGLEDFAAVNPRALPGDDDSFDPSLLRAGVYVASGHVFGDVRFRTQSEVLGGEGNEEEEEGLAPLGWISNTVVVDLGRVEFLELLRRPFGGRQLAPLKVEPQDGARAEVWIRHFCDLERPDSRGQSIEEMIDYDFALNYLLLDRIDDLRAIRSHRLPVPRVMANWARGGNLAGRPNACAGPITTASSFKDPLEDS